jgi:hypothetical protein
MILPENAVLCNKRPLCHDVQEEGKLFFIIVLQQLNERSAVSISILEIPSCFTPALHSIPCSYPLFSKRAAQQRATLKLPELVI